MAAWGLPSGTCDFVSRGALWVCGGVGQVLSLGVVAHVAGVIVRRVAGV